MKNRIELIVGSQVDWKLRNIFCVMIIYVFFCRGNFVFEKNIIDFWSRLLNLYKLINIYCISWLINKNSKEMSENCTNSEKEYV